MCLLLRARWLRAGVAGELQGWERYTHFSHVQPRFRVCNCVKVAREGARALAPSGPRALSAGGGEVSVAMFTRGLIQTLHDRFSVCSCVNSVNEGASNRMPCASTLFPALLWCVRRRRNTKQVKTRHTHKTHVTSSTLSCRSGEAGRHRVVQEPHALVVCGRLHRHHCSSLDQGAGGGRGGCHLARPQQAPH